MTSWVAAANPRGGATESECSHLQTVADVQPSTTEGCEDCLREGSRWLHLRECLECGHVGCCDNSPRKHATAHHHASQHPIIRSFEPGENWAWCYPDELFLVPA